MNRRHKKEKKKTAEKKKRQKTANTEYGASYCAREKPIMGKEQGACCFSSGSGHQKWQKKASVE